MRRRAWGKAAVLLIGVGFGFGTLLVATGVGRRVVHKAKVLVSDARRARRERRNAERLAAEGAPSDLGPDVRLPVAEPIFETAKGLADGWMDYGWSPHDLTPGKPARLDLSGFGGLILAHPGLGRAYGGLLFRYRAPEKVGDFLEVRLEAPGGAVLERVRAIQARAVRQADGFADVWIPMRELNPYGRRFERIVFHAWRSVGPERIELDSVGLTAAAPPRQAPRTGHFQVDCGEADHPISPLIFGIATSFADPGEQQWTLGATGRRWGGNSSSRYNPDLHAWNLDQDWFFRNAPVKSAESFLEENRVHGLKSALTVPMLGWVAKDTKSYSFPVSGFGPQQRVAWDLPDDGNGVRSDGTPIPPPPATATSVSCPPQCIEQWIGRIRGARQAGGPGVDLYILDNEPGIWHNTHRDVHPEPLGYDELLDRTIAYGTAVRRADPDALIAGPAECCWLNYYFSAKDVAASVWLRPDRLRHWNVPLLPWYLRKLRDYEKRTGARLLDVVDVHFYPTADVGPPRGGPTDPA
ncbi:MAG TPA: glycoside hydrolase family 44 protein, partial [Vicinamibacteria bacterium]|nr:glycoside hydrolase family 44 protein [Vicinamibacteria bacterium]